MSAKPSKAGPASWLDKYLLMIAVVALALVAGVTWLALRVGSQMDGVNGVVELNPVLALTLLAKGMYVWPQASTMLLVGAAVLIVIVVVLIVIVRRRVKPKRTRVDESARLMGRGADIASISEKHAAATAKRLGVEGAIGTPLGVTLDGSKRVWASYEDMITMIAGPRVGKTQSLVIPAVLEALGALLVTSNKRDVVDDTRAFRAEKGQVWVFDPQGVAGEEPTWWWNPLSYVTNDEKAAKLAEHFASGSRQAGAKTDAYFDPTGQDLLAAMLLAASLGHRPITDMYRWLADDGDTTAVEILKGSEYTLYADSLQGVQSLESKQRGGIYGTALQMASSLKNSRIAAWITPGASTRPEFRPDDFVRGTDTLYSLSKEGKGSAGPLVLALTAAVVEAAEEYAVTQPGGRLTVPMAGILDEAANVCRWLALPDLYSHYGSRGINLMTILQSWSQGIDVWGQSGMKKLWSASNVKMYAGGVTDDEFLESLAKMIGDHHYVQESHQRSRQGGSVSRSMTRERILDVADLGALPRGRAVVLSSGSKPTLIRTVPWYEGPHAAVVGKAKERAAAARPQVTS